MKCMLLPLGYDGQKYRHKCQTPGCGREVRTYESDPRRISVQCGWKAAPKDGPGAELKAIFESIDVHQFQGCGCTALMRQMNRWGVDGCKANRERIVAKLRIHATKYGWGTTVVAGWKALATGLALEINPFDRYGSLVDLAIERAALASAG